MESIFFRDNYLCLNILFGDEIKKPISEDIALLIEAALGIPAHIFVGMQMDYNIQIIKQDPSFLERLAKIRKMTAIL